jgi:hypothetical protein
MGSGMTTGTGLTSRSALALLVMPAGVASVVGVMTRSALAVSTIAAGTAMTSGLTDSDAVALLLDAPDAEEAGATVRSADAV